MSLPAGINSSWLTTTWLPANEYRRAQQLQMDQILAKVKAEGLASLTPAERKFLEQASKHAQK